MDSPIYDIDAIAQGFFFGLCFLLGLLIFFTNWHEKFKGVDDLEQFLKEINASVEKFIKSLVFRQYNEEGKIGYMLTYLFLNLLLAYALGHAVNSVADNWIDSANGKHLGLKSLWCDQSEIKDTDNKLKIKAFDEIFKPASNLDDNTKQQIFYNTKHLILNLKEYNKYLMETNSRVMYNQVFCFSSFVLFFFCYLNFLSIFLRSLKSINWTNFLSLGLIILFICAVVGIYDRINVNMDKYLLILVVSYISLPLIYFISLLLARRYKEFFKYFITIFLMYLSLTGYIFFASSWKTEEFDESRKVYGILKTNSELSENDYDKLFEFYNKQKSKFDYKLFSNTYQSKEK